MLLEYKIQACKSLILMQLWFTELTEIQGRCYSKARSQSGKGQAMCKQQEFKSSVWILVST